MSYVRGMFEFVSIRMQFVYSIVIIASTIKPTVSLIMFDCVCSSLHLLPSEVAITESLIH